MHEKCKHHRMQSKPSAMIYNKTNLANFNSPGEAVGLASAVSVSKAWWNYTSALHNVLNVGPLQLHMSIHWLLSAGFIKIQWVIHEIFWRQTHTEMNKNIIIHFCNLRQVINRIQIRFLVIYFHLHTKTYSCHRRSEGIPYWNGWQISYCSYITHFLLVSVLWLCSNAAVPTDQ